MVTFKIALPDNHRATKRLAKDRTQKDAEVKLKSISDSPIPLFDGSKVFVSKADLAKAYVPYPAIYTSRVADLIVGKDELKRIAHGKIAPKMDLFQEIITHVCQVFTIQADSVQAFIDHKLATIKQQPQ